MRLQVGQFQGARRLAVEFQFHQVRLQEVRNILVCGRWPNFNSIRCDYRARKQVVPQLGFVGFQFHQVRLQARPWKCSTSATTYFNSIRCDYRQGEHHQPGGRPLISIPSGAITGIDLHGGGGAALLFQFHQVRLQAMQQETTKQLIRDFNSIRCDYRWRTNLSTDLILPISIPSGAITGRPPYISSGASCPISIPSGAITGRSRKHLAWEYLDFNSIRCDYRDFSADELGKAYDDFNSIRCDYRDGQPLSLPL